MDDGPYCGPILRALLLRGLGDDGCNEADWKLKFPGAKQEEETNEQ